MNLCACDSEEREHGMGAGVNATMLSQTLAVISLAESAARAFQLRKKTMNLCACDSEERSVCLFATGVQKGESREVKMSR